MSSDKTTMKIGSFFAPLAIYFCLSWIAIPASRAEEAKNCECPQVTCGPCQKKVSTGKEVKFCSWGNINVCKKYICENVSFYFGCLTKLKDQKSRDVSSEDSQGTIELDYEAREKKKTEGIVKRSQSLAVSIDEVEVDRPIDFNPTGLIPAENESLVRTGFERSPINMATVSKSGKLAHVHYRMKQPLRQNVRLYVGDEIINETEQSQSLQVEFDDRGKVNMMLGAGSKIIVQDPNSLTARFQPFLHLLFGEVEAEVDFKEGSLDILAGQIIVRNTAGKAHVKYLMVDKHLRVQVESHRGRIAVVRAHNVTDPGVVVNEGSYVSWYTDKPLTENLVDDKSEILNDPGVITPVFAMADKKMRALGLLAKKEDSELSPWNKDALLSDGPPRNPAAMGESEGIAQSSTCNAPEARFQQCAWSCEGNDQQAKECMAQVPGTSCIRRICNADGEWGQPTPFATSYRDLCPAKGVRVGSCRP